MLHLSNYFKKVVVNALIGSIPSVLNVILVCLVFWLIFSIMGVQLLAGKFYKCVQSDNNQNLDIKNETDCLSKGHLWLNSKINFDDTLNGFLGNT